MKKSRFSETQIVAILNDSSVPHSVRLRCGRPGGHQGDGPRFSPEKHQSGGKLQADRRDKALDHGEAWDAIRLKNPTVALVSKEEAEKWLLI